ncbi:transcription factor bHLH123 [Rosa sericea]
MADEFQNTGNWWDSSSRNRFETGASPPSSSLNSLGSFGWQPDMIEIKARSSMDSGSVSGTSSMVFHDPQKLQGSDSSSGGDPSLHMMGLGLNSQATDWNQAIFRGEKAETSFRSILQDNMNSNANFQQETHDQQQLQWRDKLFTGSSGEMSRGFSLDQTQFSPQYSSGESTVTCQGLPTSFQMDSAALYGTSPTTILQGLLGSPHDHNQPQSPSPSIIFPYQASYGINSTELLPSWSNKVPQFLRTSPPKHPSNSPHSHLQFSNNAPFWNAPHEAAMKDVRPTFFPSLQPQFPTARFDEKPKNISEVHQDSGAVVKKSGSEAASKRPRNETSSTLPAFKVRKEKMGDRITALQQLVSPFGKTDTASVLSEAIEYIKFLHEQVSVLSNPYMKSGAAIQHQQKSDKSKDLEGPKHDLRSRGLCLVPVSSTFPAAHETTVDFWTPTFGGTFR